MLAGPNVRFLPGTNPNSLNDCHEAGNDEDPLPQAQILGMVENGGTVPLIRTLRLQELYHHQPKGYPSSMAILLDGKYREDLFDQGVYNYVEKYMRTFSSLSDDLYCYAFVSMQVTFIQPPHYCLLTIRAINMSKFNTIEWEINTYVPP